MFPRAYLYFSAVLLICIGGFWQSFFSHPLSNHLPHLVHGILATLWLVLLVSQAWLVRARKMALHRLGGKLAYVLAPLFVVSGWVILFVMLAYPDHFPPGIRAKLAFYDTSSLLLFSGLVSLALIHRGNVQKHARYMSATALVLLPPAIPRLVAFVAPGSMGFDAMLHLALGLSEAALLLLVMNDFRIKQKSPIFLITLLLFVLAHLGMYTAPHTTAWQMLIAWPASVISG